MNTRIKKRLKSIAGQAAGITGIYARSFRSRMTIVAFHRVSDAIPEDGLTCGSAKFEAFCEFFREHFRVVPLADQVAAYRSGGDTGGTLSITFDDGYLDNYEVAAPILRKLALPATFFVVTGYIGTSIRAAWDEKVTGQPAWMQWQHVCALASQGFEVGSHTDTHIDLGTADPEMIRAELRASKQKLQELANVDARLFAYPFGGPEHISERSRKLVQEAGFDCCVSCFGGTNPLSADPYFLRRIGIGEWLATPDQFGYELMRHHPAA
jgi:peptidoglycan/xylan/chitin deacetylase (PgdA/CDA1 family)